MLKLLLKSQIVYILHTLYEFLHFKVTRYIFMVSNSAIFYLLITKILSIYNMTSCVQKAEKIDLRIGYRMICRLKVSFEVMSTLL